MSSLADYFNTQIKSRGFNQVGSPALQDTVYSKTEGVGLFARNLCDGIQDQTYLISPGPLAFRDNFGALPATFLHNNVITPNKVYPPANISQGRSNNIGQDWNQATLVALQDDTDRLLPGFSTARTNNTWNHGVLYPHDSNSVDYRAYAIYNSGSKKTNPPDGFKAPSYYYTKKDGWKLDQLLHPTQTNSPWQNGAGSVNAGLGLGNPQAISDLLKGTAIDVTEEIASQVTTVGAWGAGFHANNTWQNVNQFNKKSQAWSLGSQDVLAAVEGANDTSLWTNQYPLTKYLGETNYNYRDKYSKLRWDQFYAPILNYINNNSSKTKISDTIHNQGMIDTVIPWVSNPTDLINIQNMLYLNTDLLFDQSKIHVTDDWYWGWNEIPTRSTDWNQSTKYKSLAFIVPHTVGNSTITSVDQLDTLNNTPEWTKSLVTQLNGYMQLLDADGNSFLPNKTNIVFALTIQDGNGHYYLDFVTPKPFSITLTNSAGKEFNVTIAGETLTYTGISFENHKNTLNTLFNVTETSKGHELGSAIFEFDAKHQGGSLASMKYVDPSLKSADASFDNIAGLYRILDKEGSVLDIYDANRNGSVNDSIDPSHAGYYVTALSQWVNTTGIRSGANTTYDSLTGTSSQEINYFEFGQLYAPLLIVNGGKLYNDVGSLSGIAFDTIRANPLNKRAINSEDIVTYFSFKEANPDKMEHVRTMSNGAIGWEDMDRGIGSIKASDDDFNDSIQHFEFI